MPSANKARAEQPKCALLRVEWKSCPYGDRDGTNVLLLDLFGLQGQVLNRVTYELGAVPQ